MKISTIVIVAAMLMSTVSSVSAQEWSNFGGGQYVINAKSGNIPVGDNWSVMGIYCLFSMPSSGFTQHFIYAGVNKGYFTPYLGFVGNWRGRDLPYLGTFVDIPLTSSILSSTEFDVMFWDGNQDLYWWQGVEYGWTLNNHSAAFGLHTETIRQDETNTQYGFHFTYASMTGATYFGDNGWNIRCVYNIPIN